MPLLGLPSLLFILVLVVLLFGRSQLASVGKGLGQGIFNFRKALRGNQPPSDGSDKPEPPQRNA